MVVDDHCVLYVLEPVSKSHILMCFLNHLQVNLEKKLIIFVLDPPKS